MKKFYSLLILCFIVSTLTAGGKKESTIINTQPETVRVAAFVGPSGIGMARLFSEPPSLTGVSRVTFEAAGSVDVLLPKLLNGDIDIGILPPNVAAKLYNVNPNSIVAGAIVGNGMLTIITRDTNINSLEDLAGKKVSVAGQGSTPEYVFKTLLAKKGLENSVESNFSIPNPEIAAALLSNKIEYALVPEPFATVAVLNGAKGDKPVRKAIKLLDDWQASGFGEDFPMTLCVINADFAKKYPETVREFLVSYNDAIKWTIANAQEAGPLVEAAGLGLKAPIATKAIPECNFVYIPAVEGKPMIEALLKTFLTFSPESVGGKLPDDGFYFK